MVLELDSQLLGRRVKLDLWLPSAASAWTQPLPVVWLNDGQDIPKLKLDTLLQEFWGKRKLKPFVLVGICAGDRLAEYGTAGIPDYKGRGVKAGDYARFVITELLPFIRQRFPVSAAAADNVFAGFSLGAISALDIVWNYPQYFHRAAAFSGSFWWRKKGLREGYTDSDRIMHQRIRVGRFKPGLKFWFEVGTADEIADRNHNGVIDSIDDTLDLITELIIKGYHLEEDIVYREIEGGKHDFKTWAEVFPDFLQWAFK